MTAVVIATTVVPPAHAQAPSSALHLLDVPYLPQSEALCGGAAVAMVMRYWGATGVYAETFADLVEDEAGGIRGEDLLQSLRARKWDARSFAGDPALVRSHLASGRPVIALIEDRPARFHYVVLVGWAAGRVILHDPARAPFRVFDEVEFVDRWRASGSWTLLTLPPAGMSGSSREDAVGRSSAGASGAKEMTAPCGSAVEEGVRLAGGGDIAAARRLFEMAADVCPSASAPLRELAGLHALQSEWVQAAAYARKAVARNPEDLHAWRILATSLYLTDDSEGALDAWNRVGEPSIDLLNVTGLERIRYDVAARATDLAPKTLLTTEALRAARRKLSELPAAATTRLTYRPQENGRAMVDAVVIERPLLPISIPAMAVAGVRAVSDRELIASVATPSGGGELWTISWRWWERRPRVALGFAAPAPVGGVWRVEAFDERQTYSTGGGDLEESRRGAVFAASDWIARDVRWEATLGIDRWDHAATSALFGVALQQRLARERFTIAAHATGMAGGMRGALAGAEGEWRSVTQHEGDVWLARVGVDFAAAGSPRAFWPGAGTGQGRDVLLRAHPLLDDGRIDGVFGRGLVHAGAEWRRWMRPAAWIIRFAPAVFVDTAQAWRGLDGSDTRWHVDTGVGLRVVAPGSGVIRIDCARGLRDGDVALSIGWTR